MSSSMKLLLSLSVSGSVLFFVVLGLSKLLKDYLSKTWQYYIWLLVIFRLLLPVALSINPTGYLFQSIPTLQQMTPADVSESSVANENTPPQGENGAIAEPTDVLGVNWRIIAKWMWVPWIGVALGLFIRKITLYQSFATYIRAGNTEILDPVILDRLSAVCEEMGIRRQINLYENSLIASPLILGIAKPSIVMPCTKISDADFRYIMRHELTHDCRHDFLYKWLVQLALCLHWFNPVVYWIAREVNLACEFSCDEAVIRHLDADAQKAYGDVLIASIKNTGEYKQAIAGITLSESAKKVKERLEAIMKHKEYSKCMTIASLVLAIGLAVGGVLMGAAVPSMAAVTNELGDYANALSIDVDPAGFLVFELPDKPNIIIGAEYDEYVIAWHPLEDIHKYQIGVFQYVETDAGMALAPVNGWISEGQVADGDGKKYDIPFVMHNAMEIEGSYTQIDIAPLLNLLKNDNSVMKTDSCFAVITVIPTSGKPVVQLIELPMGDN